MESNQPLMDHDARKPPRQVIVLSFLLLVVFLVILGWGMRNRYQGGVRVGQPAPQFVLTTFDGQQVSSADLQGKVILVHFWASWCDICQDEQPILEQVWRQYQRDGEITFVGVAYADTESKAREYAQKFELTYPNGLDTQSTISDSYRIRGVPQTFVVGRDGRLVFAKVGPFASQDEVTRLVERALEK
ncbi:MAG: TlpA family protein disulfide reductase [Anaerolineae bacterium]|nr:TlpA family protein disulfide reductase [Anaerolineae bacterium]